jgi:hypothetical protein
MTHEVESASHRERENSDSVTEIAITPEMIEAGCRVFVGYDERFERPADVVPEIFRAMWRERAKGTDLSNA